jgi:hypothetical protein
MAVYGHAAMAVYGHVVVFSLSLSLSFLSSLSFGN